MRLMCVSTERSDLIVTWKINRATVGQRVLNVLLPNRCLNSRLHLQHSCSGQKLAPK